MKDKTLRNILILAILIRLLIMPFYFHPDIKTYHFQASFLSKGVTNIYDYLAAHKKELPLKEEFVYYPLTYFFLGGYQILISPLLGDDFYEWLSDANSQSANDRVGVYRYLFLLKLPYLAFDIAIAFLLMRIFTGDLKKKVFTLWLFNPFTIILIYVFSNVDVIPVALTVASVLLATQKKLVLSAALLGLAAGFKAYPLLFLPFLLLFTTSFRQVILMVIAAIGVFAAIVAPFWSSAFQQAAFVSGLTTRIVFPGLSIGFGETLMASIISLSALFFYSLLQKDKVEIWKYYLALLLLLFSFIHFHIQWLLWVAPFIVILVIRNKRFAIPVLILALSAFLLPILYADKSMSWGLLQAYSGLFNLLPLPLALVQIFYDPLILQSVLHSLIAGGSLVLIYQMIKQEQV